VNKFGYKIARNRFKIVAISAGILLISNIYSTIRLSEINNQLTAEIENSANFQEQLKTEAGKLIQLKAEFNTLTAQATDLRNENAELNDKVGAFAKQAATCEAVKKKLKIK
jgi:predicted nuclease with TOPRIM domain